MLQRGANVNRAGAAGVSVLHHAAQGGNAECVKALIEAGCNVSVVTAEGDTPLHFAGMLIMFVFV